ncbi:MAG: phosphodiesterase [Opitutales bacterium]|nr:phosphodiesterase [Opitutales bacterium]
MTPDEQPPDFLRSRGTPKKPKKKSSRRGWLKGALGLGTVGAGGGIYTRYWEPRNLRVSRHSLPADKFLVEKKLRFLHLSDFHASDVVPFEFIEEGIEKGLAEKPDAAFITGDFITSKLTDDEFARYAKILGRLTSKVSTFACLGNHDGGKWIGASYGYPTSEKIEKTLAYSGVFLLNNRSKSLFIKGQKMTIAGVGDLWNNDVQPDGVLTPKGGASSSSKRPPVLLLSHNPDSKEILKSYDWDLMLCGHTHGGQCVLPLIGTPFAPVEDHRYVEGLHEWKGRLLHVTRGVGNLHGLRFNCRPEVCLLETTPTSG